MAELPPDIFSAHWMRQLGAGDYVFLGEPRLAEVRALVARRAEVFLSVEIEQLHFHGVAAGGALFLEDESRDRLQLGTTVVTTVQGETTAADENSALMRNGILASRHGAGGVCLAKPLPLSERRRQALAFTFGLPMLPLLPTAIRRQVEPRYYFYRSPAFAALHAWAVKSPRRVAGAFGDTYLGLWPLAALKGVYVEPTAENVARARARATSTLSGGLGNSAGRKSLERP